MGNWNMKRPNTMLISSAGNKQAPKLSCHYQGNFVAVWAWILFIFWGRSLHSLRLINPSSAHQPRIVLGLFAAVFIVSGRHQNQEVDCIDLLQSPYMTGNLRLAGGPKPFEC